jgi:Asparagine synthase
MSSLELAAGYPIGSGRLRLPRSSGEEPFDALEASVAAALRRTPCCVGFSGGVDSSLVLAAAVRSARAQGCPPPVAVSLRYPSAPATDETDWQELVLSHLGRVEHVTLELSGELDVVGPFATAQLRQHGPLFPANVHSVAPLLEPAAGGSLLLGLGGDEVLGHHYWTPLNAVLARRARPRPRDVVRLAVAMSPSRVRGAYASRRPPPERSWLRPHADRRVRALERRAAAEPLRFSRAVASSAGGKALRVACESVHRLGDAAGVQVETPLLAPRFLAALARAGGGRGWGDRAATVRAITGDRLPEALLDRRDKAVFTAVFFGAHTRRFAAEWSGDGLDASLVDPDALRREWLDEEPDFRSALLLQVAWLHSLGETFLRSDVR